MRYPALIYSILSGLLLALPVLALEQDEASVKAAFIYNFTKYVEWPPETNGQLLVCLLGDPDPLLTALIRLEGKQSQGRIIHVHNAGRNHASLENCRVIVVGASETVRVAAILGISQKQPALTVSEIEHFADSDGMIGLVVDGTRVQFEINAQAALRANLRLSAQLMKLARKVVQ
jgi:hypothetical protein